MDDTLTTALESGRLRRRLPPPVTRRRLREGAGIPQEALAQAVGVDRATISRWETGEREPRARHLERYVEVLDRLAAEAMRR
jgi:transcriptional regulator with XRE-family HTH domain